jgi:hypothetical protein
MSKLAGISFIGIDEQTDFNSLIELSKQSRTFLEFGILYSNSKMGKDPRYPTRDFIDRFFEFTDTNQTASLFQTAIHLCGSSVQEFLDGKLDNLVGKFNRIQLNFSMKEYDGDALIKQLLALLEGPIVILQFNKSKEKFINKFLHFKDDMNVRTDILFDGSGGFGRVLESPLPPLKYCYCGYAGGISPTSVKNILEKVERVVPTGSYYYIDMESGIRENNQFSVEKCKSIIHICNEFNN